MVPYITVTKNMLYNSNNPNLKMKIERLKTSKNLQESIKRNNEIMRLEKEYRQRQKEGYPLGASIITAEGYDINNSSDRYQGIKNICKMFGLTAE